MINGSTELATLLLTEVNASALVVYTTSTVNGFRYYNSGLIDVCHR